MELLIKNIAHTEDRKQDNSDKKPLFDVGRRPRSASEHKEEWAFIQDIAVRENIAYQMQYLEFQVLLYNEYQIYLTVVSLLCKNIMAVIGGVVESALHALVKESVTKAGYMFDDRMQFLRLIDEAYDLGLIDKDMQRDFHLLRKTRNLVHLSSIEYQEYSAYTIEEANSHISTLIRFIEKQKV